MSGDNKNILSRILPSKGDSPGTMAGKIVFLVSAVVLMIAAVIMIRYFADIKRNEDLNNKLAEAHTTVITSETAPTEPPVTEEEATETAPPPPLVTLANMEEALSQNPDTAGWVAIDGTKINNVVVQCADNDYYLDHSFEGKKSQPGTVFADYRNILNDYNEKQSDNIVIYGHNQADGSMFGTLKKYKVKPSAGSTANFQFYTEHPTIYFSNLYEEYTYKIVAAFVVEVEPRHTRDGIIFDYHNYLRFGKKRPYQDFIDGIMSRTTINTGVDVQEGDKFLTLSTCSNEFEPSRFIVIGRRLRDGESPEVDTSKASINYNALEPDYTFIYNQ